MKVWLIVINAGLGGGWLMRSRIIKLDIDGRKPLFRKRLKRIKELLKHMEYEFGFKVKKILVAETVRGFHVLIYLSRPYPLWLIIIFQMFLGSDKFRELYNARRLYMEHPANVLHEERELSRRFKA